VGQAFFQLLANSSDSTGKSRESLVNFYLDPEKPLDYKYYNASGGQLGGVVYGTCTPQLDSPFLVKIKGYVEETQWRFCSSETDDTAAPIPASTKHPGDYVSGYYECGATLVTSY